MWSVERCIQSAPGRRNLLELLVLVYHLDSVFEVCFAICAINIGEVAIDVHLLGCGERSVDGSSTTRREGRRVRRDLGESRHDSGWVRHQIYDVDFRCYMDQ